MKKMTCKQLGGACDHVFYAETFEELAQQSKEHGTNMFQKQDPAHLEAMQSMMTLMKTPNAFQNWMEGKKREFEALPEN